MNDMLEALIMPVQDAAHHQQVWESLEYARRIGDTTAITLLMAQLAHSQSWRPAPDDTSEKEASEPVLIHAYTRAQALEDGTLVDVSEMAKEAGFIIPVAITAALHADINDIPEAHRYQSYTGRLWDCLHMLRMAIAGRIPFEGDDQCMVFSLIMHIGDAEQYRVKSVCGPGDDAEPVISLMKPDED